MIIKNDSWNLKKSYLVFAIIFDIVTADLQLIFTENTLSVILIIQINLIIISIIKVSYFSDILNKSDKSCYILCWNSTF